jgi:hypothetical protein
MFNVTNLNSVLFQQAQPQYALMNLLVYNETDKYTNTNYTTLLNNATNLVEPAVTALYEQITYYNNGSTID